MRKLFLPLATFGESGMAAAKEKFLGIATISTRFKMHFPEDVASMMGLEIGDRLGFYVLSSGEVVLRKM